MRAAAALIAIALQLAAIAFFIRAAVRNRRR